MLEIGRIKFLRVQIWIPYPDNGHLLLVVRPGPAGQDGSLPRLKCLAHLGRAVRFGGTEIVRLHRIFDQVIQLKTDLLVSFNTM